MNSDEKVVARFNPCLIDRRSYPAMEEDLHGQYVLHSAYAELEKHSERIEVAYLASESRAEDAESQVAELREAFARLALQWSEDALKDQANGMLVSPSEAFASAILRTLAAKE